ncbi:MAG: CCA tRNA nucleotidyltransferase [Nakamurella sp.]
MVALTDSQRSAIDELAARFPVALELGQRFADAGFELYLVGGSVRDALLGRLGHDLDFTTDARPTDILGVLDGWADTVWDTGIEFGTVGASRGGAQLEITTFRADLYDGVTRNPTVTFGDSLAGDLVRRDFTVNAMAVSMPSLQFIDPNGGLTALDAAMLDTPQAPEVSFRDDPLRMMRACRFVSQLGLFVKPRVVEAMTKMSAEIGRITPERIQVELSKLMCGADPSGGLELLTDAGLAEVVLPELPALRLERDEHHQHKDVYQHTLTVVEQAIDLEGADPDSEHPDLVLRLAALLHDIGKPATRRFEAGGGVSFHHHEVVGAKLARTRLKALRYPKHVVEAVGSLVFLHLRFHGYGDAAWTDSAVRRYATDAAELLPRLHKLVRADCTTRNPRRRAKLQSTYDELEHRVEHLAAQEDLARVRPDLDGNAIMTLLGVRPGPIVGRAWAYLKELRLDHGPLDPAAAEIALLAWAAREGLVDPATGKPLG